MTPRRPPAGEPAAPAGEDASGTGEDRAAEQPLPTAGVSAAERDVSTRSRRQLLSTGGAAVGAVALLAGCSDKTQPPSNIPLTKRTPGSRRDVEILNRLLAIEYKAVAAYTALVPALPQPANVAKPAPGPPPPPNPNQPIALRIPLAVAAAREFLGHEVSHAGELQGIITQAGGTPVKARASYKLTHQLGKLEIIRYLHGIEQEQLAAYLHAVTTLPAGRLRAAVAAILANEAQHISVLRLVLRMPPAPSALVMARE